MYQGTGQTLNQHVPSGTIHVYAERKQQQQ